MATTPVFIGTSNIGFARPIASEPTSDGTGANLYNLVTAATNGTRVDRISIKNSQNTAALSNLLVVRFYLTDTSGNNPRLIDEVIMPAITRTVSVLGPSNAIYFPGGLFLKNGHILKCSVSLYSVAQQVDIVAYGGDM